MQSPLGSVEFLGQSQQQNLGLLELQCNLLKALVGDSNFQKSGVCGKIVFNTAGGLVVILGVQSGIMSCCW